MASHTLADSIKSLKFEEIKEIPHVIAKLKGVIHEFLADKDFSVLSKTNSSLSFVITI